MSLHLMYKSTGWIMHWVPETGRAALCGDRPKRGCWRSVKAYQPASTMCPTCAKIKAARDQQRQGITEGLMVAQAVEASRYEN